MLLTWLACAAVPEAVSVHAGFALPHSAEAVWPSPAVRLRRPASPAPAPKRAVVAVDPGHGAGANRGALSSFGAEECVHTLWLADLLSRELGSRLRVHLLRTGDDGPSYAARVQAAEHIGAEALISLHADARGPADTWSPRPGETWRIATESPGFSVLWSSEGRLGPSRQLLARTVARHLTEAGFLPYAGGYDGLYETDPLVPGVYRDLRGLYVLRKPTIPSVIIESHNALDPHEVARWAEPGVAETFAAALEVALAELRDAAP